ncbi:hypothetical protein AGDE_13488 [Angomonas deanei]|uniref:Uncharacterized protein n=1 Tax=Angomonas deanei TaxID=59799 RepID=A0A7G2CJ69_9TRYP|nr:hypothetical protein AGDE_13488 [Angomonas deanei]CAD2219898.1 hypothetical protein, conserved [Angomonas deanei]|eukprot:EPY22341.1 hypothetical protein AGDE_13488 [Angomonas deanei]
MSENVTVSAEEFAAMQQQLRQMQSNEAERVALARRLEEQSKQLEALLQTREGKEEAAAAPSPAEDAWDPVKQKNVVPAVSRKTTASEIEAVIERCPPGTRELIDAHFNFNTSQYNDLYLLYRLCAGQNMRYADLKALFSLDRRSLYNATTTPVVPSDFYIKLLPALPLLQCITGDDVMKVFLSHRRGGLRYPLLQSFGAASEEKTFVVNDQVQYWLMAAGLTVETYVQTMVPLLQRVTQLSIAGNELRDIHWCATLPPRINEIIVEDGCAELNFEPLLRMRSLRTVTYKTGPQWHVCPSDLWALKQQLEENGVVITKVVVPLVVPRAATA